MMRALCGGHFTVVLAAPGATGLASWSSRTTPGRLACVRLCGPGPAFRCASCQGVRRRRRGGRRHGLTRSRCRHRLGASESESLAVAVQVSEAPRPRLVSRGGRRLGPGRWAALIPSAAVTVGSALCDSELEQRLTTSVERKPTILRFVPPPAADAEIIFERKLAGLAGSQRKVGILLKKPQKVDRNLSLPSVRVTVVGLLVRVTGTGSTSSSSWESGQ
jgi:hypothetical protein